MKLREVIEAMANDQEAMANTCESQAQTVANANLSSGQDTILELERKGEVHVAVAEALREALRVADDV